jgi:CubicO group peptidase (beta-lactamase class C family)
MNGKEKEVRNRMISIPGRIGACFILSRCCLITLALGIALAGASREAIAAPILAKDAIAKIDAAAREFITQGVAPGVSVAVMQSGRVLFAKAYGDANLETDTGASPLSVFRAGSITKEFTAAAVMRLVQDRRLALDDPIAKYVPELSRAGALSVRMLLNQTSGLCDYTEAAGFALEQLERHSPTQVMDFIASMNPLTGFAPGTAWAYSNTNYFVLGVIVERVSGQSLSDYLARYVIAPAGLMATAVDHERDVVPRRATGYVPIKGDKGRYQNAPFFSMDNAGGAGALRTTVLDMARWQQALFASRIVNATSLAAMTTPGKLSDGSVAIRKDAPITLGPPNYGFGLELGSLDGIGAVGHGGAVPGFTAYLVTFPSVGMTVAVMTNGQASLAEPFREIERAAIHGTRKRR